MRINHIAAVCLLMGMTSLCQADPVTLNITGNIVASPCQISSDSVTKAVDLGQNIQASDLQTGGLATTWIPFTIDLTSCPGGTTKVIMTMHGSADPVNPNDMYHSTGTAQNVSVQLQSQAADLMGDGKSLSGNIASNAYSYQMRARAYTQNGGVTPGTIVATVTATFVYN
ncbi:fimbrial protein [Buttiauxella selenatireducens]|uniref:Fimbrial protein n=1 Tax=Buttiauxella selenatireducens TaxID=3073902 RepID=A0ABY9SCV7_9ENTR|nr:fimbrial protein [Buttiauxella sp. R73]WMY75331.1 fimbrial protein [Buttiauxella sp. R73]